MIKHPIVTKFRWVLIAAALFFAYLSLITEQAYIIVISAGLLILALFIDAVEFIITAITLPFIIFAIPINEISNFKGKSSLEKFYIVILTIVVYGFFIFMTGAFINANLA